MGIQSLFDIFEYNEHELYLVGGAVRDLLLGEIPHDYDFATDALPEEIETWFEHTSTIGSRFGTVGVIINKKMYEITTYRKDSEYVDGRHPEAVAFTWNFKEDVKRRDFTINGLLMDRHGAIFDCVGGIEDLEKGIVRCIGDPFKRFEEDKLRKWRGIRLATEKGMILEEKTQAAIQSDPDLTGVSIERIQEEFKRIIMAEKVDFGGAVLIKTGLLTSLLQNIFSEEKPEYREGLSAAFESMTYLPKNFPMRLGALLLKLKSQDRLFFLKAMKFSKKEGQMAMKYCQYYKVDAQKDIMAFKKALATFGLEEAKKLINFQEGLSQYDQQQIAAHVQKNKAVLKRIILEKEPLTMKDLAINGTDLQTLGLIGEAIKKALEDTLDYVYCYPENNDRQVLLKRLESR